MKVSFKHAPEPQGHSPTKSRVVSSKVLNYSLIALGCIALGCAIYFGSNEIKRTTSLARRVELPKNNVLIDAPIKKFPHDFKRMVKPGMMSNLDGTRYCKIETVYPKTEDCDYFSQNLEELAKEHMDPREYFGVLEEAKTNFEGGFMLANVEGQWRDIQYSTFGENPLRVQNFNKALKCVEKTVLKDPKKFFSGSASSIKKGFLKCQKPLVKGFYAFGESLSGFRDDQSFVTPDRKTEGIEGLLQLAIDSGGKSKEPELYDAVSKKFRRAVIGLDIFKSFTPKELKFFETYIGTINPDPAHIPKLLSETAQLVKEMGAGVLSRSIEPVKAATIVHKKIGEVHAFKDGNGRLSRLWMNVMLMLGGDKPVAIPNDDEYTEAVIQEARGAVGVFEKYLRYVIQWNRKYGH